MKKNKMGLKGCVEGGVASVVSGLTTHPLDLVKVRMQLYGESATSPTPTVHRRPGPIATTAHILRREGPTRLFSGASATALRQALYTARMGAYDVMKNSWSSDGEPLPLHLKIAAGLVSGGVGAVFANPADVAMVRMMADGRLPTAERRNYKNVADSIRRMAGREGMGSLWRGSSPAIYRAMLLAAGQLATYDQVKEGIVSSGAMVDGVGTHVAAGIAAGVAAAVASNPPDVVKTRIMNMRVGSSPMYRGPLDCAVKTVRGEGAMALYKGFVPTVTRQGLSTIALFVTLEQARVLLKDLDF